MISYSSKVGLRKPGTLEWARSQIDPDSDGLAEWIAYQSGVLNQDQVESLRQWWHDYETRSIIEIETDPDVDRADLIGPEVKAAADRLAALKETIRKATVTLDGLPPDVREQMAHRTRVRAYNDRVRGEN